MRKNILSVANQSTVLIVTIISLLALGFHNQFIQDDAFISFRYAENLVQGHGLIWNIGDANRVEGYTNFLWTLLIALGLYLDFDPIPWSMFLGFIFGAGTFIFTYHTSFKITDSRFAALLSVILLGTNYTFSSYITGGLETQLQTFFVIISVYVSMLLFKSSPNKKPALILYPLISFLFSFAILTRIDSILFCGVLFIFVCCSVIKTQKDLEGKIYRLVLLIVPGALIGGSWLLLKYIYYGDILPNTYYVKASGNLSLWRGLVYVSVFFVSYGLLPFVVLGLLYCRKVFERFEYVTVIAVIALIWLLYIIKVAGDFMEFRFFVPIMPILYILVSMVVLIIRTWPKKIILFLILMIFSYCHAVNFKGYYGIESISQLNGHIKDYNQDWSRVGRVLGDMFSNEDSPVVIGTTAAGAIPFYSNLPTIDMHGLNDQWIARNGVIIGTHPGHTRYTTIQYLIDSKVNLVLGHPKVKKVSSPPTIDSKAFFLGEQEISILPQTSKVIEIPLNQNYRIDVLYLTRSDAVDKAIKRQGLVTHSIN